MPQTDAERLLSPDPAQRTLPAPAFERPQPSDADRLLGDLRPPGMFGEFTGPVQGREFDFPEITDARLPDLSAGDKARVAGGLMFALDENQQRDILQNNITGAQVNRDRFGNPFVIIPGEGAFYVNRPGPSFQDFTQLGALATTALPAGRVGAAAGSRLLGANVGRVGGVAAAEGLLSAGTDVALRAVGSEQPVNLGRAATATVAGAGGEVLLPVLARIVRGAVPGLRRIVTTSDGQLTLSPEARLAVQDAGLDPDALTQDFIRRLNVEVDRAARPAEAVRVAEAESLPTPVPLTRGDVTRTASDQMFEDQARKGSFGRAVEAIITGRRGEQQAALRSNVDEAQARLSGGRAQVLERGQGGQIGQQALEELRRNADGTVQAAYRTAREAGQAGLAGDAVPGLVFNLERAAAEAVGELEFAPKATRMLARLAEDGAAVGDGHVLVTTLFNWRRTVTNLAAEATDPTDARALRAMRRAFDAQVVDIVERGLLEGNEQAVDLWLGAIRSRREFGSIWEAANKDAPNYLVDRLTQTIRDGDQAILRVAPEAAANFIFGSSKAGLTAAPQLARQLQRLKGVLVEGGRRDAWDAIREEAFIRLSNQAEGAFDLETARRSFSGAKFATAIDDALTRNGAVMRILFAPDEIALMEQVKRVALSVTTTTQGGQNFSGTANAAANIFRSALGKLIGRVFGPSLQAAAQGSDAAALPFILRAVRSSSGRAAVRPALTPGVGGAAGAVGASEPAQELRR